MYHKLSVYLKNKYSFATGVIVIVVLLDQITKLYVHYNFDLGESIIIFEEYLDLTYIRNKGAAFGFLSDSNETFRKTFFLALTPLASIIICRMIYKVKKNKKMKVLSLSLILSGAIGNYINRIHLGFVVDFLDMHFKEIYHWPAFNIADIAIVGGAFILVLTDRKKDPKVFQQ